MAGIQYHLVAQDKEKNDFSIVPITVDDYSNNHRGCESKKATLEKIDLFSTKFGSEEHFIDFLYQTGKIQSKNVSLYIAFSPMSKNCVKFYEVLYNRNNNSDITDLRAIASYKAGVSDDNPYYKGKEILDRFYKLAFQSEDFYRMLSAGMTNIYPSILEQFVLPLYQHGVDELKNYKGGWALKSYELLRNVVETEERYKNLYTTRGNVVFNSQEIATTNSQRRHTISQELCNYLIEGLDPNQMSIFDFDREHSKSSEEDQKVLEQKKDLVEKSKKTAKVKKPVFRLKDIPTYEDVSFSDKRHMVMGFLPFLPNNAFLVSEGGKKIEFNPNVFSNSIDEYHLECFNRYLTKTMKSRVMFLSHSRAVRDEARSFGNFHSQSETEFYSAKSALNKYLFSHDDELNRVYAWCRLYQQYQQLEPQHTEGEQDKIRGGAYVKTNGGKNNS